MNKWLYNCNILITGGAGSLGYALVRKLLALEPHESPHKIVILSRDDHKHAKMEREFNDRRLRFWIGDIRDYERLEQAFDGIDYIIHAAALKHVDRGEYNPLEYKKTIVDGAENIIRAAIKCGVKRVVALSTDKACLYGEALVELDNGKTKKLNKIVNYKEPLQVLSYNENTKKLTTSKITNWYTNDKNNRDMYFVSYKNNQKYGVTTKGVIATLDHPILTSNGWKQVKDIDIQNDKLVTSELMPNDKQMAVFIGTMMGDSSISRNSSIDHRSYFSTSHSTQQLNWLKLKQTALKGLVGEIHCYSKRNQHSIKSKSSAFFSDMYPIWYSDKKYIPRALVLEYLEKYPELLLASWFQDDVCKADNNIRLATHNFSESDVLWLVEKLNSMGIESYIYHPKYKNTLYNEIRLTINGTKSLCKLISPYVILDYKLPFKYSEYNSELWNIGDAVQYLGTPIIKYIDPDILAPRKVMCIDVANTHNFIVGGVIVHNCSPHNTYGACKLLSDKLFIAGNNFNKTKFSVIRYGNVVDSNGSATKNLRNSESDTITIFDDAMTRFWITLEHAAELTLSLLEHSNGYELLIPKIPSMNVLELFKVMKPNANIVYAPIRAGEKIHECMITKDDSRNTYEFDQYYIIYNHPDYRHSQWIFNDELGYRVTEGFEYNSLNNPWYLNTKTAKLMLAGIMPLVQQ